MSMQSLMSMQTALKQATIQGNAHSQNEGKINVLKSEMKLDGGGSEEQKERLEKLEAKAGKIAASQMGSLGNINKQINETAKREQEEAKEKAKTEKKDKVEIKKKDDDKEKKKPAAVLEDAGRIYDAQGIVQVVAETTGTVSAPAESEKAEGAVDVRA